MNIDPDDQLTPDEAAAFAALPRHLGAHDDFAEQRTVDQLRQHGLLGLPTRRHAGRALSVALSAAAAVVLFAAGTIYGRSLGGSDAASASPSVAVQQAGTAYVQALMRLSQASDTERAPGLEAGAATLRAAATSLAMVNPDDSIAHRIRSSLDLATMTAADSHAAAGRSVIWF
jgi:hypothetical protein